MGTISLKNPSLVKEICRLYPGKIAVVIDTKNGFVSILLAELINVNYSIFFDRINLRRELDFNYLLIASNEPKLGSYTMLVKLGN